jgi:hypothetical protein
MGQRVQGKGDGMGIRREGGADNRVREGNVGRGREGEGGRGGIMKV